MPPTDLPDEPILIGALSASDLEAWREKLGASVHVGEIDGRSATTAAGLFESMATAFDLPEHFGANWDALHDVMGDLSWIDADGYVVLVTDAALLLSSEGAGAFETFVAVMSSLAELWADGGGVGDTRRLVFRTLLLAADDQGLRSLRARLGDGADVAVVGA